MTSILLVLFSFGWLQTGVVSTEFSTLVHPEIIRETAHSGRLSALRNQLEQAWSGIRTDEPNPAEEIHYEGLLDNDPERVKTLLHLEDMDKLALFYWHYALFADEYSLRKMRDFSLSWAKTFHATGNPINENKLLPIVYSYFFLKSSLRLQEQLVLEKWLKAIAVAEIGNARVPLNNWETKRIHLVGTIGMLLDDETLLAWAEDRTRYYLENALFPDGTSIDIRQRDALSYHVSGLKPLLQFFITLEAETGRGLQFFRFKTEAGASVARSLDYVVPYATGEKVYHQWENSKVELDRRRAAAGIEKYRPGVAYTPEKSYETMALAGFFDAKYPIDSCNYPLCVLFSSTR
jgi:hypothetical protein